MGPIQLLKKIRDIGVPADMPAEEAKYVQMINLWALFGMIILLWLSVNAFIHSRFVALALTASVGFLIAPVFFLNRRKQYILARVYGILLLYAATFGVYCLEGFSNADIIAYMLISGISIYVFPKKNRSLMIFMVGLGIGLFLATILLQDHFRPYYRIPDSQQIFIQWVGYILLLVGMIAIPLISRHATDQAEELLRLEKQKVSLLSNKLKAYLPHQFVASLASGAGAAGPDYRRKRLTIFFSDIQGFTSWTDKLAPEEVREILNHYLSEMSAIAHKWGGTIDKFIGDALMIFFGDPEFTDDRDHALRCVKMAMQMQERMAELRQEWRQRAYDEPLNIRIGIHTGWATVGNFGAEDRLNYTALGSAVNLASRLETASAPDQITLSHTTWLLVKDEIPCAPKGQLEVKGFAEPVKIYVVTG